MECLVGEDLSFRYGGRPVLEAVSVRLRAGRASVLVGPSGSGKTTLLWLLAGLLRPSSGSVRLAGADSPAPSGTRGGDRPPATFGMVFQQPALWDHLTAEKHLDLVLSGRGLNRSDRRRRIEGTLARMRLGPLRRRRPGQLSGGERQRLAIARAMVGEPEWLLLDEPLAHLDGPVRTSLFDLLREVLADARAGVLLATHNSAEALRIADDVVVLLDGRVAQSGPAEEVYRRPASLPAALVLGPAAEVRGEARGGVLLMDGAAVIEGIDPSRSGPASMILRPEDVAFEPDPAAAAVVHRCEFTSGAYCLRVRAGETDVLARHHERVPPGAAGRLRLTRTPSPRA